MTDTPDTPDTPDNPDDELTAFFDAPEPVEEPEEAAQDGLEPDPEEVEATEEVDEVEEEAEEEEAEEEDSEPETSIQEAMKEAAEAKKQAVAAFEALQLSQRDLAVLMQGLEEQGVMRLPSPPSQELAMSDPMRFNVAMAQYHTDLQSYQRQQYQVQQVQQQQRRATEAAMQAHLSEQQRTLAAEVPEFANPATAATRTAELLRVGADYGFSEDELSQITDARTVKVLNDAAKYRALAEGKTTERAKAPSRTVKPKARRSEPPQLKRAKQIARLRNPQSEADELAVFFNT